jgi:hypothetical protein
VTQITRGAVWFRTGPPRRLAGLETRGHAIRRDVLLPPAAGPARTAALVAEGRRLLAEARRGYGMVLLHVLIAAGPAVPPPVDLARPWSPDAGRALVTARRAQWRKTRRLLARASSQLASSSLASPQAAAQGKGAAYLGALEDRARAALDAAVDAFDHLEDTDLASDAHAWAHTIAELVAGLFGCRAKRENDRWFDVCRLSLMHLRVGMSPGYTARRHCSICGCDLTVCDHIPGVAYPGVADRSADGRCTICASASCLTHRPGATYPAVAHPITRQADLHEISAVARPRDPLARNNAIEIPAYAVTSLPDHDAANASLHCEWCMAPCTGFTSVEEALGFA